MWLMFSVRVYGAVCCCYVYTLMYVAYIPTICVHYESLQSFLLSHGSKAHITIINVIYTAQRSQSHNLHHNICDDAANLSYIKIAGHYISDFVTFCRKPYLCTNKHKLCRGNLKKKNFFSFSNNVCR